MNCDHKQKQQHSKFSLFCLSLFDWHFLQHFLTFFAAFFKRNDFGDKIGQKKETLSEDFQILAVLVSLAHGRTFLKF